MTNGGLFHLLLLSLGVFTAVLLALQLYFAVVDEGNAVRFSDTIYSYEYDDEKLDSTLRESDATNTPNVDDVSTKGEVGEEQWMEENEPVHFIYGADQDWHDEFVDSNNPYQYAQDNELPILIWWTHFTGENGVRKCSQGNCYITENRTLQDDKQTHAFLFYGTDYDANDLPLPRKDDHEWGLFHEESPKNNAILYHEDTIVLFNHTATFRRHSDYPLPTQCLESIDILEKAPWHTLEEKTTEKDLASVVYVQSGCSPPSDRDAYIQELMKYIKVDSLGQCLNNRELPEKYKDSMSFEDKGFYKIVAKYKFTLAFENAICDDYLTEKIWRPLEIGSVPIYRGSPSILDWMPNNHSVILVDDFAGPKELAEFIKKLDTNDTEYLKYLEFKKKGGVTNERLLDHMEHRPWGIVNGGASFINGFTCFVCDKLHETLKRRKTGLSIIKHVANQDHFGCPRPVLFHYPPPKGTENWERELWLKEFDRYIPIAKRMKNVVLSGGKRFN